MELRQLKSTDIFLMIKILKKIGFTEIKDRLTPEKLQDMMSMLKKEEGQAEEGNQLNVQTIMGFNIVLEVAEIVLSNLPNCEKEIYDFIATLAGVKVKDVADLPMGEFANVIVDILQKDEFKDFFKAVSRLFNQMN